MFRITARTVLELGSELISSDIIAFYELIKNGFDAGTKSGVDIHFNIVLRRNYYLSARERALKSQSFRRSFVEETIEKLNPEAALGPPGVGSQQAYISKDRRPVPIRARLRVWP